jgi:transportin-3
MMDMCRVQMAPLAAMSDQTIINKGTASDPTVWLDRIAALFRYCKLNLENNQAHPCLPVLSELWPVLSNTMDR